MKRRRKFELAIADLQHALGDPLMDDRYGALFSATWNLYPFNTKELAVWRTRS